MRDGRLIAAAEEERFRRIKHWAGFPGEAVRWCLADAGVSLADVDHVAINQDNRANLLRRAGYLIRSRPRLSLIAERLTMRRQRMSIAEHLEKALPGQRFSGRTHAVEHHLAHLASAFLVSPFEDAVAVSVDGFGDFASAAWGVGSGAAIR
ncbi:MAG TPA: carbamoyltransferase N-terminal domain-containing protein, partial [Caulobacteraceae bacterium]